MKKIKAFDKANIGTLRKELEKAFDKINDEYGIKLSVWNIRFDGNEFRSQVNGIIAGFDGPADEYKNFAELFGAKKGWLGKSFKNRGEMFTLIGLMPRKRKNPFLVKRSDGKKFIFPIEMLTGFSN